MRYIIAERNVSISYIDGAIPPKAGYPLLKLIWLYLDTKTDNHIRESNDSFAFDPVVYVVDFRFVSVVFQNGESRREPRNCWRPENLNVSGEPVLSGSFLTAFVLHGFSNLLTYQQCVR